MSETSEGDEMVSEQKMAAAQDKADQMARTLQQVTRESVVVDIRIGIRYVGLYVTFASERGRDKGLAFHKRAGGADPKRVRGLEAFWMFG